MRLKLLALILIISVSAQAQIYKRLHFFERTVFGIAVDTINNVTNNGTTLSVSGTSGSIFTAPNNEIDSITHVSPVSNNLYSVISNIDTFSQFKTGINLGGLNPYPYALSGNYTSLVVPDTVFRRGGVDLADETSEINDYIISYHTLSGRFNTNDMPSGENIKYYTSNIPADSVFITKLGTNIIVNGVFVNASANKRNIPASNGLAHELTSFLNFPVPNNIYIEIISNPDYSRLEELVEQAAKEDPKIIDTLKSTVLTLMAPTNSAFDAFLTGFGGSMSNVPQLAALNLLRDHMLINRKFYVNLFINSLVAGTGSKSYGGSFLRLDPDTQLSVYYTETAAVPLANLDIMQTNGVIHSIDGVLTK